MDLYIVTGHTKGLGHALVEQLGRQPDIELIALGRAAGRIEAGALDIHHGAVIGLVVQTQCHYFESIAFPQRVHAGLRVAHLGRSSVRYELGLFADDAPLAAAVGQFTHVYVDRATRRPVPLPPSLLAALQPLHHAP